jgi:XTP/dITP diphosphohydrolase
MDLIIASNNKHKIEEIKAILSPYFKNILSQGEINIDIDVEENGKTFLDNAFLKACAVCALCNKAVLADDSGLCVDALDGKPGIFSARYAGALKDDKKNNIKLLSRLKGKKNRAAKFVCAVALVYPDGRRLSASGSIEGEILEQEIGNRGFGYDPLFFVKALNKTFAEASAEEKNKISHRHDALINLAAQL